MNAQTEIRQVRPADQDCPSRPHPLDNRRVERRHRFRKGKQTLDCRGTRQIDVLLDRKRHSVERTKVVARLHRPISSICSRPGLVREHTDNGIYRRVHLLDSGEVRVDHLTARHLPEGDHPCEFVRA